MGFYCCNGCSFRTMSCDDLQSGYCEGCIARGNTGESSEEEEEESSEEEEEEEKPETAEDVREADREKEAGGIEFNELISDEADLMQSDSVLVAEWVKQCKSASLKRNLTSWLSTVVPQNDNQSSKRKGPSESSSASSPPGSTKKHRASGKTAQSPINLA